MRNITYPKIRQFRNIIRDICGAATYVGNDENGDPIYDQSAPLPIVTFDGTVKLHGTNASVSYNKIDGMWSQSRKNIITPLKDNNGFAFFANANKSIINSMIDEVIKYESIDTTTHNITIYGEWCGKGIQKNVSISALEKMWVIFGVKISTIDELDTESSYWVNSKYLSSIDNRIYNISSFPTFTIDIDFSNPGIAQNKIVEMVLEVEKECPVGKALGVESGEDVCTIGEGIVFTGKYKNKYYRFKAKGAEHSATKVKTIAPIDPEKLASINEFVEYAVTENRLNQAIEQVFTSCSEEITIKKMGEFLRWISKDIFTEEDDVLINSNLEPKDVNKQISNVARKWFMCYLDKLVGL